MRDLAIIAGIAPFYLLGMYLLMRRILRFIDQWERGKAKVKNGHLTASASWTVTWNR